MISSAARFGGSLRTPVLAADPSINSRIGSEMASMRSNVMMSHMCAALGNSKRDTSNDIGAMQTYHCLVIKISLSRYKGIIVSL
jgi:hypothetical protein